MAARLNPKQIETTKAAIKTTQLTKRLCAFALGEVDPQSKKPVEMSKVQVTAALGLLKKTLPDTKSIEMSNDPDNPLVIPAPVINFVKPDAD